MKKLVFILLVLILTSQVLAIKTNLKQEYHPGETLIAGISGNFLDNINQEDILFYSGRAYIPMIYNIAKIQNSYYLYAILPEKERNYTLIVKNARYLEAGKEKTENLQFNFSATGNSSLFSVNPGFIITNKEFSIKATANQDINLKSGFLNSTQEIFIYEGKTKTLSFSISEIEKFTFTNLTLEAENTTYSIPIAIFTSKNISAEAKTGLSFSKSFINLSVLKDSAFQYEISIFNTGQEDIENIEISKDIDAITLTPGKIDKLEAGSLEKINLTIRSEEEGFKEGKISAVSDKYTDEISVYLLTTADEEDFQNMINKSELANQNSCADLKGAFCKEDEECSAPSVLTLEGTLGGLCCLGECKKPSSYGKTAIIILIVIVLIIIMLFVFKKLKTKKRTSEEIVKEKSKAYEERFKSREVRGGLTKV